MGFFNNFPYTNFHEMNLDWVISEFKKLENYVKEYTAINNVSYAGVWDIRNQYPQWAIVSDGDKTYMSNKPVPAGIAITNTEYWLQLADLDPRIAGIVADLDRINSNLDGINKTLAIDDYTAGKTIVFFGDSYCDDIPDNKLTASFPLAARVINYGKGGTTIAKISNRRSLQDAVNDFRTEFPNVIPDIVLYLGGNNDCYVWEQDENSVRSNCVNMFGIANSSTEWTNIAGSIHNFFTIFKQLNPKCRFGLIPLVNLSHGNFFKIAKSALMTCIAPFSNTWPCSILWNQTLPDKKYGDGYWSNGHPTENYNEVITLPVISGWVRSGMPNNSRADCVDTFFVDSPNTNIEQLLKDFAVVYQSYVANYDNTAPENMRPSVYIWANAAGDLNANPIGCFAAQPWAPIATFIFQISNTPTNLYITALNNGTATTKVINL